MIIRMRACKMRCFSVRSIQSQALPRVYLETCAGRVFPEFHPPEARLNSRPEAGFTKSSGAGRTRSSTAKNYVGAYISCSHLVNNKSAGAHDGMDKDVHDVSLQSIFQRWHIHLQYSQWY